MKLKCVFAALTLITVTNPAFALSPANRSALHTATTNGNGGNAAEGDASRLKRLSAQAAYEVKQDQTLPLLLAAIADPAKGAPEIRKIMDRVEYDHFRSSDLQFIGQARKAVLGNANQTASSEQVAEIMSHAHRLGQQAKTGVWLGIGAVGSLVAGAYFLSCLGESRKPQP